MTPGIAQRRDVHSGPPSPRASLVVRGRISTVGDRACLPDSATHSRSRPGWDGNQGASSRRCSPPAKRRLATGSDRATAKPLECGDSSPLSAGDLSPANFRVLVSRPGRDYSVGIQRQDAKAQRRKVDRAKPEPVAGRIRPPEGEAQGGHASPSKPLRLCAFASWRLCVKSLLPGYGKGAALPTMGCAAPRRAA